MHLNLLERLLKRIVRIITGSEYLAHTDNLFFYSTQILKLNDLHKYLLLVYFFNNKDRFNYSATPYFTRHSSDPVLSIHRLTSTEHSVRYSAARLWLDLPTHVKNIQSKAMFKSGLKAHLIDGYGIS